MLKHILKTFLVVLLCASCVSPPTTQETSTAKADFVKALGVEAPGAGGSAPASVPAELLQLEPVSPWYIVRSEGTFGRYIFGSSPDDAARKGCMDVYNKLDNDSYALCL